MGQLTPLKLFPNFSVDFGDSSIATDSSIFVVDSLLHVMNLSLTLFSTCSAESELPSLVSDFYQRSKNKYISLCLLPIFERFPKTWHAIPCLSKVPAQLSFPDSLIKWIELSPTESRSGLQELALVFGVTIPLV